MSNYASNMSGETTSSHQNSTHFDVMNAFSRLDTGRKMALFDNIMTHRLYAYRNTLHSIWPEATEEDARKLELVLRQRLQRLQGAA